MSSFNPSALTLETKYFVSRAMIKPAILAPRDGLIRQPTANMPFFERRAAGFYKKRNRTAADVQEAMLKFQQRMDAVETLDSLFTDYDREVILPSTCPLGIWTASTSDYDRLGHLGAATDVTYDKDVVDTVIAYFKKFLTAQRTTGLSLPRGKSIGWPYFVPSTSRAMTDLFLGLSAATVVGHQARGANLSETYRSLGSMFGDPFCIEANRFQHKGGPMQVTVMGNAWECENFEMRSRIINIESKMSVAAVRSDTKRLLAAIMSSPTHTQDRSNIQARLKSANSKGWAVVALDISKFDFSFGGKRGMQQLALQAEILGSKTYFDDSKTSWDTDNYIVSEGRYWKYPGDAILRSGMAQTTLVGATGGLCTLLAALTHARSESPKQIMTELGSSWDALMWGDDIVLMLPDRNELEKVIEGYQSVKITVTQEPNLKFLGYSYAKGEFKGTMDTGYSLGRFVQQQFFPERQRIPLLSLVGYISRLLLVNEDKREQLHRVMLPLFPYFEYDKVTAAFPVSGIKETLSHLIPQIERISQATGAVDDILNVFTHGLGADDGVRQLIPDDLSSLLGMDSMLDLSDPGLVVETAMRELHLDNASALKLANSVQELAGGQLQNLDTANAAIISLLRLTHQRGSVVY